MSSNALENLLMLPQVRGRKIEENTKLVPYFLHQWKGKDGRERILVSQ